MVPKYQPLVLGFFGSFILVGVPYWQLAYSQIALPNSLFGFPLCAVFLWGALLRFFSGRLFFETFNLWPFEIVIACLVGLTVGALAAWLGGVAQKIYNGSDE